jgi:hypothetical protein
MRGIIGFGLISLGLVWVEARPSLAQYYQQTCRPNYLGGYSCSDSNGYDIRVKPSLGPYGGVEAQDNYGNRCRRYQDFLGRIVTRCD